MQLRRTNLLVRWAYLISIEGPPVQVSLCWLFWRAVAFVPLVLLWAGFMVGLFIATMYEHWPQSLYTILVILFGIAAIVGGFMLHDRWEERIVDPDADPSALSVLWQGFKATKDKFCPLIDIVR